VISEITEGRLVTEISIYAKEVSDGSQHNLNDDDIAYLESVKHVKAVTRRQMVEQQLTYWIGDYQASGYALVSHLPSEVRAGLELSEGRMPNADHERDDRLLISEGMMREIEAFTGTAKGALIAEENSNSPLAATNQERTYDEVKVYANDLEDVKGIAETIREEGFLNHSIANELEQVNVFFLIMKIGLIFVGTIALLKASIGIYNTMTMAVTERSQNIGIMKAIGMHPRTIKSVFLIESSYIGILGAVIGTIVSYVISQLVNMVIPVIIQEFMNSTAPEGMQFSYIPVSFTVLCVTISIAVAILSGMRPAIRATRVDVLKALRRDI
jgi:acetoin utilization transport system permease protein